MEAGLVSVIQVIYGWEKSYFTPQVAGKNNFFNFKTNNMKIDIFLQAWKQLTGKTNKQNKREIMI